MGDLFGHLGHEASVWRARHEPLTGQVGDQVAEAVHPHDAAPEHPTGSARLAPRRLELQPHSIRDRRPQVGRPPAAQQRGGDGGEAVAAVEGRPSPSLEVEEEIRPIDRPDLRSGLELRREQPVVGGHEGVSAGVDYQQASRAPHAGIHHRQVHGARRKGGCGGRQQIGRAFHVAGRHLVREVDELRPRGQPQDRPLDRADVVVGEAEVGEQREQRCHARSLWHLPASGPPPTTLRT